MDIKVENNESDENAFEVEYIHLYCRVCLQLPQSTDILDVNLIYDEDEGLTYKDVFKICTEIDLLADINLPNQLCKNCGLELQMAYDFHKKVKEAKRLLTHIMKQCEIQQQENESSIAADDRSIYVEEFEEAEINLVESPEVEIEQLDLEEMHKVEEFQTLEELQNVEECEEGNLLQLEFDDNCLLPDSTNDVEYRIDIENNKAIFVERLSNIEELNQVNDVNLIKEEELDICDQDEEIATVTKKRIAEKPRGRKRKETGPFKCDKCEFECDRKDLLYTHRHRKHKSDTLLKCPKCDRVFHQLAKYESHLKRPTCDTYPEFICEYCEKRCIGLANFNIHMRFHKKQYPFVCHLCGKEFMMAVHLRNHIKVKHENQRFCCGFPGCAKLFQTTHALQTHYYNHVGQLPFECTYCKTGFPTKGRLSWHINKRHGFKVNVEQLESMRVCESVVAKKKLVTLNENELEFDEFYLEIES